MATSSLPRQASGDSRRSSAPALCIGMPVFNGERFLSAALTSLLEQTFSDFELVISDNASNDGTEEICREFSRRDQRIHYIRQPRNFGGVWNFNHVFEYCRSPYFSWAAHDDLRAPTYYQQCVEVLEDRPGVAWCHSRTAAVDANGDALTSSPHHAGWASEREVIQAATRGGGGGAGRMSRRPGERFRGVLRGRSHCLDLFGVIRSEILRDTRGMLDFIHSDKVLVLELATRGEYFEVPEELFVVRLHDAQATAQRSSQARAAWNARTTRGSDGYFRRVRAYAGAAMTGPLTAGEKLYCLAALLPYMMQVRKLPRVLAEMAGLR